MLSCSLDSTGLTLHLCRVLSSEAARGTTPTLTRGMTPTEIVRELRAARREYERVTQRARRDRDVVIRKAARAGMTTRGIGREIGLSHAQVAQIVSAARRKR
jgi:hypothetical protein